MSALEGAVASLDTRIQARTTTGAGSLGQSVAALEADRRIEELARQVEGLNRQVAALQRQLEQVNREAVAAGPAKPRQRAAMPGMPLLRVR